MHWSLHKRSNRKRGVNMEKDKETIVVSRWHFEKSVYELGLFSEDNECQESWELVPGEEIPKILLGTVRRCTYGAFSFGDMICWNPAPLSEFIDARCQSHVDKRMQCSIYNPGKAANNDWGCTEENPLCPLYQRCLCERVCYLGVFADREVDVVKLGESDDYKTRGFLQGLAAVVPIYLKDGGKMSLMRSKRVERELAKAVSNIFLDGRYYRVETKPFAAPYKRRTPELLLSFLNADPEKCAKLLESLAMRLMEEAKRRLGPNDLIDNLSLGSPEPCFNSQDEELVDIEQIKRLCKDSTFLEKGKLRLKAPRKKTFFGGEVLSGKPPHVILHVRSGFLQNNSPFMLSINPNRLNGLKGRIYKSSEQSSLLSFVEGTS